MKLEKEIEVIGKKVEITIQKFFDEFNSLNQITNKVSESMANSFEVIGDATEKLEANFLISIDRIKECIYDFDIKLADTFSLLSKFDNQESTFKLKWIIEIDEGMLESMKEALLGLQKEMINLQEQVGEVSIILAEILNGSINESEGILATYITTVLNSADAFNTLMQTGENLKIAATTLITLLNKLGISIGFITTPIGAVIVAIAALIAIFMYLWKTNDEFREGIIELWTSLYEGVCQVIEEFINMVIDTFTMLKDTLTEKWEAILTTIQDFIDYIVEIWEQFSSTVVDKAKQSWDLISSTIRDAINNIKEGISNGLSKIKNTWLSVWNDLKCGVLNIWNDMNSGIKGAINSIIKAMNGMINSMNKISFSVPSWVPVIGGMSWGFNLPNIPALATGTNYIPRDTLAFLHKGEAVVPKKYNPALGGSTSANNHITIYLDGRKIYEGIDSFLGAKVLGGV
ncbi:phage tail protein [Alkaliphilus transvaalensis]|uniref:phage tail protein n=1 Tax=Alkaliphilus transvaalensis TaxID=114628 RepID=UPI00047B080C|nr:hypothetical protein [Alkaliphilus transvaalensis]